MEAVDRVDVSRFRSPDDSDSSVASNGEGSKRIEGMIDAALISSMTGLL
jgi:hypothetical protein